MTSVQTTMRFDEIKEKVLPVLAPYGIQKLALFGSVARGEDSPASDIDLLVTLAPPSKRAPIGLKWFGLIDELSEILQRPVDLVTEDGLSPYLRPYIEKELVVIYEAE